MGIVYISEIDIKILMELISSPGSVGSLAEKMDITDSRASKSVTRLSKLDLVEIKKVGRSKNIKISSNKVGIFLRAFIENNKNIQPGLLFAGNGLFILSSIVEKGASMNELVNITGLSRISIMKYFRKWETTGIVIKKGHGGRYLINPLYEDLHRFLSNFIERFLIMQILNRFENSIILFSSTKKVLFSFRGSIELKDVIPAAYTHLAMKGYDVITSEDYYLLTIGKYELKDLEAIIQAIRIDSLNPRPRRFLKELIIDGTVQKPDIRQYSREYGIEDLIGNEVRFFEREKIFQDG